MKPELQKPFVNRYPISFKFGEKPDWYTKVYGYPHNGNDWAMPVGQRILAAHDGVISYADNVPDANGKGINISHTDYYTQYWHLSVLTKKYLDEVKQGDLIGYSGDNGFATGAHLHFGVYYPPMSPKGMRGWVDPLEFLTDQVTEPGQTIPINRTYRVMPGDTIWKISVKFYGEGYRWRQIYDANRLTIKDPALIYPLQKLLIP